jgi:tripartite-type tricarboxylate transporter receptor subunit TctC
MGFFSRSAFAILFFISFGAIAQSYPDRPIKLVIPFTPGGSTDVIARVLAKPLGEELKTGIIIDNKPGAGTVLGAEIVAKSAPDGYTLLLSSGTTYVVNAVVMKKLPYNPQTSFDPLGIVGSTGLVLLANSEIVKANNLKELIAEAKTNPKISAFGSFGSATTSHFVGEMLNAATGMKLTHIPYKGSAPEMSDLIGGQIPLSVDTVVAAVPQLKSGKIKAIFVTSQKRAPLLPKVPTAIESGYPSIHMSTWFAIVGPQGLSPAVQQKLESAIAKVMSQKETKDALIANGFDPEYGTPEQYRARVFRESGQLQKIATQAQISVE